MFLIQVAGGLPSLFCFGSISSQNSNKALVAVASEPIFYISELEAACRLQASSAFGAQCISVMLHVELHWIIGLFGTGMNALLRHACNEELLK